MGKYEDIKEEIEIIKYDIKTYSNNLNKTIKEYKDKRNEEIKVLKKELDKLFAEYKNNEFIRYKSYIGKLCYFNENENDSIYIGILDSVYRNRSKERPFIFFYKGSPYRYYSCKLVTEENIKDYIYKRL